MTDDELREFIRAEIRGSSLSRLVGQAQGAIAGVPQIAWGTVNGATGAAISGQGFTSARSAVGTYALVFAPVFAALPSVVADADTSGGASVAPLNGLPTVGGCNLYTLLTATGALADRNFCFVALG